MAKLGELGEWWNDNRETAVGGIGGAAIGFLIGGPIGAVIGAGLGATAGAAYGLLKDLGRGISPPESGALTPPPGPDYSPLYRIMAEQQRQQNIISKEQLEIAKRQHKIAEERYELWKSHYKPVEEEVLSPEFRMPRGLYRAGLTRASVVQPVSEAIQQIPVVMHMRRGIYPNSPAVVESIYQEALEAGHKAGMAQTIGREQEEARNIDISSRLVSMGLRIPVQASQMYTAASGTLEGASKTLAGATEPLAKAVETKITAEYQTALNEWQARLQASLRQMKLAQQEDLLEASMWVNIFVGLTQTAVLAKVIAGCIPSGQYIDLPDGNTIVIDDIKTGDVVMGWDGEPCKVLQKHQYSEWSGQEFCEFELSNGCRFAVSARHWINSVPAYMIGVGDNLEDGVFVLRKQKFTGVKTSYDILTDGPFGGYCMGKVRVNSMIPLIAGGVPCLR